MTKLFKVSCVLYPDNQDIMFSLSTDLTASTYEQACSFVQKFKELYPNSKVSMYEQNEVFIDDFMIREGY